MLLPKDPKQRPELWEALQHQLAVQDVAIVVGNGTGDPYAVSKRLSSGEADALVARMKAASVSRISESRGAAIGPHFSGTLTGRRIYITEFIATSSRPIPGEGVTQFQSEIETVALDLLYGGNALDVVLMPVQVPGWTSESLDIQGIPEGISLGRAR